MNQLEHFFKNEDHRLIHKWNHYFEIYDRHLQHLKDRKINILEIGISHGGSLQMWEYYFKGNASIYAVDINPECKKLESDNIKIFIGSQEDEVFLKNLKKSIPVVDVLIDDGGHTMKQQISTFKHLFDHVAENGIYICEDLHTSYWKHFGGGIRKGVPLSSIVKILLIKFMHGILQKYLWTILQPALTLFIIMTAYW